MSVANIIDEITGKIDPKYLPVVAPTIPTLNQVLTTGNQSGGILIDAQGGNINCDALKCLSIEALTAPLFNTIAVDADLIVTQFGKLGFEDNALITCNELNTAKNVIETTNASGNAIYKVAEGNIQYETSSKLLTVNPISIPPSPFLITQGLTVNGSISAVSGDVNIQGTNPSVNFKNSSGTDKAFLDYVEAQDKVTLSGLNVVAEAIGAGRGHRMILDAAGAALTSQDADTTIQRSQTGTGIVTIATFEDNGMIQVGANGITTFPTIKLASGTDPNEFLTMSYNSTLDHGIIKTETNGQLHFTGGTSFFMDSGGTMLFTASDPITIQAQSNSSEILMDSSIKMTASSGSVNLSTPSVLLGGITTYDTPAGIAGTVQADVDNLDQVLTNNAYVPMTWYKRDIVFTIDPAVSLAFQTGDFIWRYSGLYGTTNSESRYCATLKFQIDVNISAEDMNDTIVWWVKLFNLNTSAPYYSIDFPDERFGFIADRVVNPYNGARNQCVSFSSTFNLDPGFTGQAIPVDGEVMRIEVYGWGTTSTTASRAQVSATIRPLRNMV